MTTQIQTVQVLFLYSSVEVATMEMLPVCPIRTDQGPVRIESEIVTTWIDGQVIQHLGDGTVKTWYPKPTLADAIAYSGGYFEFHKNGAVTSRLQGKPWYWGPSKEGVPMQGTLRRAHKCNEEWVFEDDCCQTDISITRPGSEPDPMFRYSFWN